MFIPSNRPFSVLCWMISLASQLPKHVTLSLTSYRVLPQLTPLHQDLAQHQDNTNHHWCAICTITSEIFSTRTKEIMFGNNGQTTSRGSPDAATAIAANTRTFVVSVNKDTFVQDLSQEASLGLTSACTCIDASESWG